MRQHSPTNQQNWPALCKINTVTQGNNHEPLLGIDDDRNEQLHPQTHYWHTTLPFPISRIRQYVDIRFDVACCPAFHLCYNSAAAHLRFTADGYPFHFKMVRLPAAGHHFSLLCLSLGRLVSHHSRRRQPALSRHCSFI